LLRRFAPRNDGDGFMDNRDTRMSAGLFTAP
jgi:hypothetical protein